MTQRKKTLQNGLASGSTKSNLEFDVFLDHAYNVLHALYEEKGSWYVRTIISRWLDDMDEEAE